MYAMRIKFRDILTDTNGVIVAMDCGVLVQAHTEMVNIVYMYIKWKYHHIQVSRQPSYSL